MEETPARRRAPSQLEDRGELCARPLLLTASISASRLTRWRARVPLEEPRRFFSSGMGEGGVYLYIYLFLLVETELNLRSSVRFSSPPRPSPPPPISAATILTFSRKHSVTLGAADDDGDGDDGASRHSPLSTHRIVPVLSAFWARVRSGSTICWFGPNRLLWLGPLAAVVELTTTDFTGSYRRCACPPYRPLLRPADRARD